MSSYDSAVLSKITGTECHVAAYDQAVDVPSVTIQTPRPIRPMFPEGGFLVLSPTLSSHSPSQTSSRASSIGSATAAALPSAAPSSTSAIDDNGSAEAPQAVKKDRRSSSVSSAGGFRRRILKLGPVHNGETITSDYVELDEE
ncbi:hypothetical protein FKW77_000517 [Venturia effusa]|uniref:Uncharacterized protein n=1 Tax=Venturia effusa TaxID=50376 RepID=A0A517L4N4_9PEZI|nr:hypothetical protein FKW77_000517 [Venturia effusa]